MKSDQINICIVGLGYVGLPLAVEFGKVFKTIGYDVDPVKVKNISTGYDQNGEHTKKDILSARHLTITKNPSEIEKCKIVIVTVPTPIDQNKNPDFSYLIAACEVISRHLSIGSIVVFESTVYPGATEEICIPIIEEHSGKKWKKDFFVGYSPERINPGDKEHTLAKVKKIVAGDTKNTLSHLSAVYSKIIKAGIHPVDNIRTAEAAKVIENIQRDVNIALMNEINQICFSLGIKTSAVLEAANTKWNFLNFKPGLVGGHCIGIDPYYLLHKAKEIGYNPKMITAGRTINDSMSEFYCDVFMNQIEKLGIAPQLASVAILGCSFKENCTDLRNSKVFDLVRQLQSRSVTVDLFDPIIDPAMSVKEYGVQVKKSINESDTVYDAFILAVPHSIFDTKYIEKLQNNAKPHAFVFDIKFVLKRKNIKSLLPIIEP